MFLSNNHLYGHIVYFPRLNKDFDLIVDEGTTRNILISLFNIGNGGFELNQYE